MKPFFYIIIGLVVLIGIGFGLNQIPDGPGELDDFAQCVSDSGANFWGAWWCPACNQQKALFGKSADLLPYTECSSPGQRNFLNVCEQAEISGYPTWDFADGERMQGVISLEDLSNKTNCPLPETN